MILSYSASGNTLTVVVRTFPSEANDKRPSREVRGSQAKEA